MPIHISQGEVVRKKRPQGNTYRNVVFQYSYGGQISTVRSTAINQKPTEYSPFRDDETNLLKHE